MRVMCGIISEGIGPLQQIDNYQLNSPVNTTFAVADTTEATMLNV